MENQWKENALTIDGEWMHKTAHNEEKTEKRGDLIITRGMRLTSRSLGVSGQCDVVEFHRCMNGIEIFGWPDKWMPYPVEYKHGTAKTNDCDRAQLCAQAICLEEMLCCSIDEGALYYGMPQKREIVSFSEELRNLVTDGFTQMHLLMSKGYTPKVKNGPHCASCSLNEICLPELSKVKSISEYFGENL